MADDHPPHAVGADDRGAVRESAALTTRPAGLGSGRRRSRPPTPTGARSRRARRRRVPSGRRNAIIQVVGKKPTSPILDTRYEMPIRGAPWSYRLPDHDTPISRLAHRTSFGVDARKSTAANQTLYDNVLNNELDVIFQTLDHFWANTNRISFEPFPVLATGTPARHSCVPSPMPALAGSSAPSAP